MRDKHPVLTTPLKVPAFDGALKVLKKKGAGQANQGEAFTLDGIIGSCDAEIIAKGPSGKGPERGAIIRHGRYTLWGFAGGVDRMTDAGKMLFVNTVFYAATHKDSPVLEKRYNKTRDGLFSYLDLARFKVPGLLRTLQQYLPDEARGKSIDETEKWLRANRPYLRSAGRPFELDAFAKKLGIPNYRREFIERCITNLRDKKDVEESAAALKRYTRRDGHGTSYDAWQKWYDENKDYLYFAECDGSVFKVDELAKEKGIPFEELRQWSGESLDFSTPPACAMLRPEDAKWFLEQKRSSRSRALLTSIQFVTSFTDYPETDLSFKDVFTEVSALADQPARLTALLDDDSAARRIIAGAILASKFGLRALDFTFDAYVRDPSAKARINELIRDKLAPPPRKWR